jgi:hypothetical protein
MSTKWMGCLKHILILTHATSEKPSESPIATLSVRPTIYQVGVASLWPLGTIDDAETHNMYMNLIFYEYELGGVPHNLQHDTSQKLSEESPSTPTPTSNWAVRPSIYQVKAVTLWPLATIEGVKTQYICMKTPCYEYEVENRWGASIITCSIIQVKNRVNIQQPPLDCETKHISGWCCILMTTSHCSRCWIALYIYKEDLIVPSENPTQNPTTQPTLLEWWCGMVLHP